MPFGALQLCFRRWLKRERGRSQTHQCPSGHYSTEPRQSLNAPMAVPNPPMPFGALQRWRAGAPRDRYRNVPNPPMPFGALQPLSYLSTSSRLSVGPKPTNALRGITASGIDVLMVSGDAEFCPKPTNALRGITADDDLDGHREHVIVVPNLPMPFGALQPASL